MNISISQEDKEVLHDLKRSIYQLNQELFKLSVGILLSLKQIMLAWIMGLSEFAPSEIKKHGLEAILIKRALRFFGMEKSERDFTLQAQRVKKRKKKGYNTRVLIKRGLKLLLFPLYVLILLLLRLKPQKNVKNNFKT